MSYTDVFGGELIFPSQLSYLQVTTAVDITLQWPTEQQITGNNIVADFLDIDATVAALSIDMPDARNASTGNKATINNIGANAFTMRDATGGVIQFVGTGQQWVLVLTDNSTEAGVWSAFQLGAATTFASAAALAGAGLQADGFGMLEQIMDSDVEAATPFTVVDGDRAKVLIYTAGAGTCNLPSPGAVANNWFFMLRNSGSGTLNIVPGAGNIDGSPSLNLDPNSSTFIFTDGANFFTVGLTASSVIAFDFVSIAVPGSGDFILSGANLDRISYRFTGALTGNRRIVVPNTTQQYWVDNQTTGAFTLEIDTAAGAGQIIPQGQSAIVYCDTVDVINAVSSTSVVFPITIGQGGTGATTAAGALTNLGAAADTIEIQTAANSGLSGGGDLTANRAITLDVNNLSTVPSPALGDFFAYEDIDDNITYKATLSALGTLLQPQMLFNTGVEVVDAVAAGQVNIKSAANGDANPRELRFTHQDGTIALFIGQDLFSEEMDIQNRINVADGLIRISTTHVSAYVEINGRYRQGGGNPSFRGSADNTVGINLTTTAFLGRAFLGYQTSNTLVLQNSLDSAPLELIVRDSLSVARTMVQVNPNADVKLYYQPGGGAIEVARTLDDGDGGFEVNNLLTGAGFERVLTESDALTFVQSVKTASEAVVASTTYQNDDHLVGIVLPVGRYGLSGYFQYSVTTATAGFKFRWTSTGGAFSGAPYQFTYRANTGASPSNADTYFTTMDGVVGAQIVTLNTGEGVGFLNGNCEIITSTLTLTTQWAQVVATGTTTFAENSWMRLSRTDIP
jgi:hypothetical protein